MNMRRIFLLFAMVLFTFLSFGGVKSAFKALNQYDYFKAKRKFERTHKYNPSIGAFGLATIYSRNDNPFHSLDSARKYILISEQSYLETKERKRIKWAVFGWTENGIDSLKQLIAKNWFNEAFEKHTINSFDRFLKLNPWSEKVGKATRLRDSIAFTSALFENTALAYEKFIKNYPESDFLKIAKDNFYNAQFNESTYGNSEEEFADFIQKNANSPLRGEAEEKLYRLVTSDKSEESYRRFTKEYAHTRICRRVWQQLFDLHLTKGYSEKAMQDFLLEYPETLLKDSIEKEIHWVEKTLLPFEENGLYGFMNLEGKTIIPAQFDVVDPFAEGLAIVSRKGRFGAINRKGSWVISPKFYGMSTFESGYSMVSNEAEKIGLIRRDGELIFQEKWEDIGTPSEETVWAEDSTGKVMYFDLIANPLWDTSFLVANDFNNGIAKITTENGVNFIRQNGNFLLPKFYENVERWNDTVFMAKQNGLWGLVSSQGNVVLPFDYELIGQLKKGKAIALFVDGLVYVNKKGEIILDDDFEDFPNSISKGSFKNGYAIVVKNEKYGRIDELGKIVTQLKYDNLAFGENAILFEEKSLWGIMDFSNKVILPAQFEAVEIVGNNYFIVSKNGFLGVVNAQGNEIIPLEFNRIKSLGGHFFAVSKQGDWAVSSHALKTEIKYKKCEVFNEDLILLVDNNGKIAYFDKSSNKLIEHKK